MSLSCHCVLLPHPSPSSHPAQHLHFLPPAHLFLDLCTQHFSHLTISPELMLLVFQTH